MTKCLFSRNIKLNLIDCAMIVFGALCLTMAGSATVSVFGYTVSDIAAQLVMFAIYTPLVATVYVGIDIVTDEIWNAVRGKNEE